MAQQLQLKRGLAANLGAVTLAAGEPAFTLDDGKLYIGDGAGKVLINPDTGGQATTAETADKLTTARTISLSGDVTGSTTFDGSANADIAVTLGSITLSQVTDAGTAASRSVGTAAGNVPELEAGGKLNTAVLPSLAITDVFSVASEAAMLALTAEQGDVVVRSDENRTYILAAEPAATLANWVALQTPTDAVLSVAGRTGAVTLTAADVGLGNVTNESKATLLTDAALVGTPTAPTAVPGTATAQVATTAFVLAQGFLRATDVIDGGTF